MSLQMNDIGTPPLVLTGHFHFRGDANFPSFINGIALRELNIADWRTAEESLSPEVSAARRRLLCINSGDCMYKWVRRLGLKTEAMEHLMH
jgi:hypothetical protein